MHAIANRVWRKEMRILAEHARVSPHMSSDASCARDPHFPRSCAPARFRRAMAAKRVSLPSFQQRVHYP